MGVLQSALGNSSRRVHVDATTAFFRGAKEAGVQRLVHISALGADPNGATDFARDKAAADAALTALDLDWIILRPSLVYAESNSGGAALIEMLAQLPLVPLPSGDIIFQPIHTDDLAGIVVRCLDPDIPARRIYELGGPEPMTLADIVAQLRAMRGMPPPHLVTVPDVLIRPLLWLGDAAGWVGLPGPLRSTSMAQSRRTPLADSDAIVAATGIEPRSMRADSRKWHR